MPNMIERLFALKIVTFNTQRNDFLAPDLAKIMRRAKNASMPVKNKHYPEITNLKKGKRAAFINKIHDLGVNKGVIIEICTYLHGVFPETGSVPANDVELDLDAIQAAADSPQVVGRQKQEAIYRFRAIVFGRSIVVEKASNTSGIQILPHVLKVVIRNVLKDSSHPVPHLINVGSEKLDSIIKSKGGVEKVTASLVIKKVNPSHRFSKLLSSSRTAINGADKIQISWFSESGSLGAKEVDEIYGEYEDDDTLDSLKIFFPGGSSVADLSEYREQERYALEADSFNRPYVTEVHDALKDYLARLRDPRREGPLTADGNLRGGYYLAGDDDED